MTGRPRDADAGSALVAVIGSVAAVAIIGTVAVALVSGLVAKQRVDDGADAAALAAADVASGALPGVPCEAAERAASANRVTLAHCEVDGLVATVATSAWVFGVPVVGRARAGPPPDDAPRSAPSGAPAIANGQTRRRFECVWCAKERGPLASSGTATPATS